MASTCYIEPRVFRGRQAVQIGNDKVAITIMCGGGHIALVQSAADADTAAAEGAAQQPTGPFDETMRDFLSPSSFFDMLYYRGVTQPVNICSTAYDLCAA